MSKDHVTLSKTVERVLNPKDGKDSCLLNMPLYLPHMNSESVALERQ